MDLGCEFGEEEEEEDSTPTGDCDAVEVQNTDLEGSLLLYLFMQKFGGNNSAFH